MKEIDLNTWPRRKQFDFYGSLDYPPFNICAAVDITEFYPYVKSEKLSVTVALMYLFARAANELVHFRYRIRDGRVVEHETVHPSITVQTEEELFSFCTVIYQPDFSQFAVTAARRMDEVRRHPILSDEEGQDDLLFMSSLPWISFTGVSHPLHMHPVDSVPRITWGKFYSQGERLLMPLSVQVHHALADGYHVGQYFEKVQAYLSHPEF